MDVEDAATAKKKAEEKKKNQKMVGFGRLFTYADGLDYLLYFIGERDRDGSVPLFDTRRLLVLVMAHARPSLFTHTQAAWVPLAVAWCGPCSLSSLASSLIPSRRLAPRRVSWTRLLMLRCKSALWFVAVLHARPISFTYAPPPCCCSIMGLVAVGVWVCSYIEISCFTIAVCRLCCALLCHAPPNAIRSNHHCNPHTHTHRVNAKLSACARHTLHPS